MSDTAEKIQQMLEELRGYTDDGDWEDQHVRADEMLVSALRLLADEGHHAEALRELCDLWIGLKKWYA